MQNALTAPSTTPTAQALAYDSNEARWAAVMNRDASADGSFYYSVATTGVFCRPSCAARPARRENVAFHATVAEARRAGFRPCKRCRPDLPPRSEREAAFVAEACRTIEASETLPSLAELSEQAGMSAAHFHRVFRRVTGVTPRAFALVHRTRLVQEGLGAGAAVTETMYAAGFNSSGRFYEAAPAMLGMTPSRYRSGGRGEEVSYATAACSLGRVLVAATHAGVCAIELGDSDGALIDALRKRLPRARLSTAGEDFETTLRAVVTYLDDPAPSQALSLPLDIRGTVFQRRVWEALQQIPAGQTMSYAQVAAKLGRPEAMRAVAGACAANRLAVTIPCHRVVGSDGALRGYRWGIERKAKLLARERVAG